MEYFPTVRSLEIHDVSSNRQISPISMAFLNLQRSTVCWLAKIFEDDSAEAERVRRPRRNRAKTKRTAELFAAVDIATRANRAVSMSTPPFALVSAKVRVWKLTHLPSRFPHLSCNDRNPDVPIVGRNKYPRRVHVHRSRFALPTAL